jgi:hypothetical protein
VHPVLWYRFSEQNPMPDTYPTLLSSRTLQLLLQPLGAPAVSYSIIHIAKHFIS